MLKVRYLPTAKQAVRRTVGGALPLLLVGCAVIGDFEDRLSEALTAPPSATVQVSEPEKDQQLTQTVPFPIAKPQPPARLETIPPERIQQIAIDREAANPDRLIGVVPGDILAQLGEPALRLQDPPAEIWQYNGRNCTLRLTLLLDVVTAEHRTVFYEVKNTKPEVHNGDSVCLAELLADGQPQS